MKTISCLKDFIRQTEQYRTLLTQIKSKEQTGTIMIQRAVRPLLLSLIQQDLNIPVLFATDRADRQLRFQEEFTFWAGDKNQLIYAEPNAMFYEKADWGKLARKERIQALTALASYYLPGDKENISNPIIFSTVRALMTRTLPRREFIKNCIVVKTEQEYELEKIVEKWVEIGYDHAEIVVEPGFFSRRGGILDIWPSSEPFPIRLDFFGNDLESIKQFDPASQRALRGLEEIIIPPASEIITSQLMLVNPEEKIDEFFIPLAYSAKSSIINYIPENAVVVFDDEANLYTQSEEIEETAFENKKELLNTDLITEEFPDPYLSWSEIKEEISRKTWLDFGYAQDDENSTNLGDCFTALPRFSGKLKRFIEYLAETCSNGVCSIIVSRQVSRLKTLWDEFTIGLELKCQPEFLEGILSEGWEFINDETHALLITDSEIFGWESPKPRSRRRKQYKSPEMVYADFKPGDWVVHIDYGIGRFEGLVKKTIDEIEKEYLAVEYSDGDKVYVPIHQADRLSRYIGTGGEKPRATRINTSEWARTKARVQESVLQVAKDLLELYAKRQEVKGFAFSEDASWMHDLEASFPYIETDDQFRAINDVKRDMEAPRPMDRLLCGDVGYGKTEVALRAAFKAVLDGKQVAVLVPTTVLAQQHYETFYQRLIPFPVNVEMLSRFRSKTEQDHIIKDAAAGKVDIVIGTHRLIQSDVTFKDLGLVIIDEEQRFGVAHKEHFKKLRTELDVLTLTATPIPRTLYLALTGARDISNINTPPEERLPIVTHIGPYSPRIVRQAILREIERGGQVFFVHNRVRTIHAIKNHLEELVPEARIGVGHGQMHEKQLSKIMTQFTKGEIDVLLSTSIIESGLDIPNANTLIVDRGDTFGLSQLYQLRGRVGRSAHKAYAYFFRHRKKLPTPEGLERLETIADNSQLGAGYSIAMRDLEMRGAGEILGYRQHGFIASVGFHLYSRLLAHAVKEMKRQQKINVEKSDQLNGYKEIHLPVNVDLKLDVGIPVSYIENDAMRLQLYRRMADIDDENGLEAIIEEFVDRFGPIPETLLNLFFQLRLKLMAERIGLSSISIENEQIVLRYPPLVNGETKRELKSLGKHIIVGKNAYRISIPQDNWQQYLLDILTILNENG